MKEDKLDRLLDELRDEPLPSPPANLKDRIRREIRLSEEATEPSVLSAWLEWLVPRTVAFAGVVFLMTLGIGLIVGSAAASVTPALSRTQMIDQALHLNAFKAELTGLTHPHPEK